MFSLSLLSLFALSVAMSCVANMAVIAITCCAICAGLLEWLARVIAQLINACTTVAALQLLHYSCCTTAAALQLLHYTVDEQWLHF